MKKSFGFLIVLALILMGSSAYAATGSQLISQYGCLGCHNPIPTASTNAGEVTLITNGINNISAMSFLKTQLTSADIQAIADYLVPPATAACTSYTYTLGACQPNGTAPVVSYTGVPAGCSGGATPATTQPCTYTPPICSSFSYSAWGACQSNGTQSRTVISGSPAGCTGGSPVLTQSCTYTPPTPGTCSYTYSSWGTCQSDSTQSRTVVSSSPAGCTGTPVLTQSCTYTPPTPGTCTYTYSSWGACQSDSTQSRTVVSSSPAGCTGTPVLSQSCTYTPPPSAQDILPVPTGAQRFVYEPVDSPVLSSDPAQAEPIGIGPAATGGDTLAIRVKADFDGPVNVSLGIYAPSIDDVNVYFMAPQDFLQPVSNGIIESETQSSSISNASSYDSEDGGSESGDGSENHGSVGINHTALDNFILWKTGITSLDQNIGTLSTSDLPAGVYTLIFTVRPSQSGDSGSKNYYRWTTYFLVK